MSQKDLEVIEGNDPSMTFTLYDVAADGTKTTTNLTGAEVECYVKDSPSESDAQAVKYSIALGSITVIGSATAGKVRVDFTSAAFSSTVTYYHLDVIRATRRVTYAWGQVKKRNV